jgi:hypothetical protein
MLVPLDSPDGYLENIFLIYSIPLAEGYYDVIILGNPYQHTYYNTIGEKAYDVKLPICLSREGYDIIVNSQSEPNNPNDLVYYEASIYEEEFEELVDNYSIGEVVPIYVYPNGNYIRACVSFGNK